MTKKVAIVDYHGDIDTKIVDVTEEEFKVLRGCHGFPTQTEMIRGDQVDLLQKLMKRKSKDIVDVTVLLT